MFFTSFALCCLRSLKPSLQSIRIRQFWNRGKRKGKGVPVLKVVPFPLQPASVA